MKTNILLLLTCVLFSLATTAQTRQALSFKEKQFVNADLQRYKLRAAVTDLKYDSVITIHYKGALYILGKYGDSLTVFQNISVDKVQNPKSTKAVKSLRKSEIVYNGPADTFIINRKVFTSLFQLGSHKELNNPNVRMISGPQDPDDQSLYFEAHDRYGHADTFKIADIWLKKLNLQIEGWHIRRLILQLYLNYNHWLKVTDLMKTAGKGYYLLNSMLYSPVYFYDGKDGFVDYYAKLKFTAYYPLQFVSEDYPKPENKYPLIPARPVGAGDPYIMDR